MPGIQVYLDNIFLLIANYVFQSLPDLTKRRISALKKLQKEYLNVESKFYEEIHKIACQLQEKLLPAIHDKVIMF